MRILFLYLILGAGLMAQTTINGSRTILGTWDASGATTTKPAKSGTTLPATCTVGEQYFKTNSTAGQNLHYCTATNAWTQQLNSGGATIGIDRTFMSLPYGATWVTGSAAISMGVRGVQFAVSNTVTLDRISGYVGAAVAGATARLAVYNSACVLQFQSAELSLAVVGYVGTVLGAPVTLQPGLYYFAWAASSTTISLSGASVPSVYSSVYTNNGTTNTQTSASIAATIPGAGMPSNCGVWSPNVSSIGVPIIVVSK